jgi:triacylglycerol lipase
MNIVLVHGILGFDRIGPVNYFNGIADHLRKRSGTKVHPPALDATAGTDKRSNMLRKSIQDAVSRGDLNPAEPIHIIAHSMGGLDARRMISGSRLIQAGTSQVAVQTLATIGTPHRGSPVADAVALKLIPKLPVLDPLIKAATLKLGNVLEHFRISLDGLHDLTTEAARDFNAHFPDNRDVKYLSYAGGGRAGFLPTSAFFLAYHEFIRLCDGEASDGVVGVSSAKWTGFDPNLWPADHADEIGHDLDRALEPLSQAIRDRYDAIVAEFGSDRR